MTATESTGKPSVERDSHLDIAARTFWEQPFAEREKAFAELRRDMPLSWHRPYESTMLPPDEDTPGFWAVTRYEDIRHVSRNSDIFASGEGILMEDFPYVIQVATTSFLAMDKEEHRRQRGIVQTAFSPKNVRKIEGWIAQHAKDLVDEMIDKGEGEFCEMFAAEMPGRIFAHFFGCEEGTDEQATIMLAAERMLAWDDPEAQQGRDALETFAEEAEKIQDVAMSKADDRRANPRDDLVSWVVNAEFEGEYLEDWEVAAFFSLLGSAANDTTRHSLGHMVQLFDQHPDQLELLMEDFDARADGAVDEILRHCTPVMQFRRTAQEDTEVGGQPIKKGEKLVMWYCSGNYDEDVYENPSEFNILREGNKHLAFGGGGPHFCLGSMLGKTMIKTAIKEVYTRMPDLKVDGEAQMQVNNFIHGVHKVPVQWTPPGG